MVCGKNDESLCFACAGKLPRGFPPEKNRTNTIVIFDYSDRRVRKAVWLLKYRRRTALARVFARIIYDFLLEELAEERLFSGSAKPVLAPVPISERRFRERGYNQVGLVASELENLDKNNFFTLKQSALKKIRYTESQVGTAGKNERLKNLRGSIAANPEIVGGKNIILLDDVLTTGATMEEARRALKAAGAKKILCVALAH